MAVPILLIHGAFSCGAHLAAWSDYFTAAGYECHSPTLPGHDPSDASALTSLGLNDYVRTLEPLHRALSGPPIVVGHSMGGLLAQRLVATCGGSALVCVASAPPGPLPMQLRAAPYLLPLLPRIMSGLPIQPSEAAFRYLALHDLPHGEQDDMTATLGAESGRAYRAMILGLCRVRRQAIRCPVLCVSGGEDRIISRRAARALAAGYSAEHIIFNARGHWLIAPSATEEVAGSIRRWLHSQGLGES